jgi:uncharacterized lipoprotein YmbA
MTRARGFAFPFVGALLLVLPSCISLKRSKDAQVFVLEPLAARDAAAPEPAPSAVVGVLSVEVAAWLDRPQIVSRGAGSQVQADDFSRWGEPLAKGVQRVVAENLAALLPDRRVVRAPWAGYTPVVESVQISLGELARQSDGSVLLEARWAVIGPDHTTLLQRRSTYHEPAGAGSVSDAVTASSQALAALSREIAGALSSLPLPADREPGRAP